MGKLILNETLTEKISKELKEEIVSAYFVKSGKLVKNADYRKFIYIVNERWNVIVHFSLDKAKNDFWEIQSIEEIEKRRKEFEEKIVRVAIIAGVPLNIAKLVGFVESEEKTVELFKHIKSCRGFDENIKEELKNSNNYIVESAIIKIIGEEAWKSVNRNRNMAISALSVYFSE